MMRTLHDLSDLKETGFGQPRPRHGLSLLWWFAHNCVKIDSNGHMTAKCDLANGAFGFHRFYNKETLLPKIYLPYYEVGNLSTPGSLPLYVTRHYTGELDSSNKDRIIVSFDSGWNRFHHIYVTRHSDQTNFDPSHTFRISLGLLREIKRLSYEDFLRETMNDLKPYQRRRNSITFSPPSFSLQSLQGQRSHQSPWLFCACCILLICALLLFYKECGLGQPWPRHGLELLYWFDKEWFLVCDPMEEDFGFHLFENRCSKHKGSHNTTPASKTTAMQIASLSPITERGLGKFT
ncbi:uncharacterized protein LOC113108961 [Carassius auratus]|uniref:Uncharacterized protein LOC113108961 n=1 Tax=Carassius auratus TaxID=7957 RepID=A0A6P6Q443_CARAU|nr:uncharacterized protein LOC113108961 [Carassius auratus]